MDFTPLCRSITMRGGGGLWRGTGNQLAMFVHFLELSEPEGEGGDRPPKFWQISQPYLNQERTDYAHHISTLPRPRIFRPSYGPDCTWLYLPHHLQRKNAAGRLVLINSRPHSTVRDCGSK